MNKTIAYLGILLAAIVGSLGLLLGINFYMGNTKDATAECMSSFSEPITLQNKCLFYVEDSAGSFVIQSTSTLEQGSVSWKLRDPQGEIVWRSNITAGDQAKDIETIRVPAPGTWTLEIDTERAQGEYHFTTKVY